MVTMKNWTSGIIATATLSLAPSITFAAQVSGQPLPDSTGGPQAPMRPAPIVYPANSTLGAGQVISTGDALRRARLDPAQAAARGLKVQSIHLRRWRQVEQDQRRSFHLYEISPDRLVYEIRATIAGDHAIGGNTWKSGTHTVVVDAQTGHTLWSVTTGVAKGFGGPVHAPIVHPTP
jgi:hypothetical protein